MPSSRPALNNSPPSSDLIDAMREASNALTLASATDLGSVEVALERLERATFLLAAARGPNIEHPVVRSEIDRTGFATRRLFEEMITVRDETAAEIQLLARSRKLRPELRLPGIDLTT